VLFQRNNLNSFLPNLKLPHKCHLCIHCNLHNSSNNNSKQHNNKLNNFSVTHLIYKIILAIYNSKEHPLEISHRVFLTTHSQTKALKCLTSSNNKTLAISLKIWHIPKILPSHSTYHPLKIEICLASDQLHSQLHLSMILNIFLQLHHLLLLLTNPHHLFKVLS